MTDDADKAWIKNPSAIDRGTVTAQLVTPEELKEIWMRPEAIGMTDDEQSGYRIVHLEDGTAFACKLSELHR